MGFASGVFFGVVMYLCRPLLQWWTSRSRNEVRRLLQFEIMGRASTYALMGLGFGLQTAGVLVLIPLRARTPLETSGVGAVVAVLFILGSAAIGVIGTRAAKRLAKQVIELRGSASESQPTQRS
jgi:hypothetical protein